MTRKSYPLSFAISGDKFLHSTLISKSRGGTLSVTKDGRKKRRRTEILLSNNGFFVYLSSVLCLCPECHSVVASNPGLRAIGGQTRPLLQLYRNCQINIIDFNITMFLPVYWILQYTFVGFSHFLIWLPFLTEHLHLQLRLYLQSHSWVYRHK